MQKLPVLSLCLVFLLIIFSIFEQDIIFLSITISSLTFLSFLMVKKWLSSGILFLILLVSIFYSIGSVFNLYLSEFEYDGFLHFYTGFTVSYLFGSLIKKARTGILKRNKFIPFLSIILFGLSISIIWEIFEIFAGKFFPEYVIGELTDTLSDLIFDTLGILFAAIFLVFKKLF